MNTKKTPRTFRRRLALRLLPIAAIAILCSAARAPDLTALEDSLRREVLLTVVESLRESFRSSLNGHSLAHSVGEQGLQLEDVAVTCWLPPASLLEHETLAIVLDTRARVSARLSQRSFAVRIHPPLRLDLAFPYQDLLLHDLEFSIASGQVTSLRLESQGGIGISVEGTAREMVEAFVNTRMGTTRAGDARYNPFEDKDLVGLASEILTGPPTPETAAASPVATVASLAPTLVAPFSLSGPVTLTATGSTRREIRVTSENRSFVLPADHSLVLSLVAEVDATGVQAKWIDFRSPGADVYEGETKVLRLRRVLVPFPLGTPIAVKDFDVVGGVAKKMAAVESLFRLIAHAGQTSRGASAQMEVQAEFTRELVRGMLQDVLTERVAGFLELSGIQSIARVLTENSGKPRALEMLKA